ncbi:MAG: LPXTG cell wall anchor domain-containing protein [bacterium]|nr:LPXTG cell wall anchor domain-containing protein [bacterium]
MRFLKESAYYGIVSLILAVPIPFLVFPAALLGLDNIALLISILFYSSAAIAFVGLFVGFYRREVLGTILCAVMSYIGFRLLLDPLIFPQPDSVFCTQPVYEATCPPSALNAILPLFGILVIGLAGWLARRKKAI